MVRSFAKIKNYLFDLESYLPEDIDREIKKALSRWEPRVTVLSFSIKKTDDYKLLLLLSTLVNKEDNKKIESSVVKQFNDST